MKKAYMKPCVAVYKFKMTNTLLAGSPVGMSGQGQDNDSALGRVNSFFQEGGSWDEEE